MLGSGFWILDPGLKPSTCRPRLGLLHGDKSSLPPLPTSTPSRASPDPYLSSTCLPGIYHFPSASRFVFPISFQQEISARGGRSYMSSSRFQLEISPPSNRFYCSRPYIPDPTCMYWIFLCAPRFLGFSLYSLWEGENYMFWFLRNGKTKTQGNGMIRWILGNTPRDRHSNRPILMTH